MTHATRRVRRFGVALTTIGACALGADCLAGGPIENPAPYFVQQFFVAGPHVNLQYKRIVFHPINAVDGYYACIEDAPSLNSDPTGGTIVPFTDFQQFHPVVLNDDKQVLFYGERRHPIFVSGAAMVTFGRGDTDTSETLAEHFALPRIAALYDSLNPSLSGSVSWKQFDDRVAVTWLNVPEQTQPNSNTLQIEMYFDGRLAITLQEIGSLDGVVGLSPGYAATPDPVVLTEFLTVPACGERPPIVEGFDVQLCPNTKATITLSASDDGMPASPGALSFRIESLPSSGTLRDAATMEQIDAAPHTLEGAAVVYTPHTGFVGSDEFAFSADDGGAAPTGGSSEVAAVSVDVGGPMVVYSEPLNADPGWPRNGDWAFGQPQGMGSGNRDPFAGATGANVFGNNLAGNYPNNVPGPPDDYTLTAGPFDCTDLTGVRVSFARWLGIQNSLYDSATFLVSDDDIDYNVVWQHSGPNLLEDEWTIHSYDISAIADGKSTVYLRWSLGSTDNSIVAPGWNIDDVRLHADAPAHACPGDVNGDGVVDFDDFSLLLQQYGESGVAILGDLTCDGVVNFDDFSIVLANYGAACP